MWNRLNGSMGFMGGAGFSQLLDGPQLVLDDQGNPLFGWSEGNGVRTGVARWTGTAWDTRFGLFNAGQNPLNNIVPELVVDARGKIWVAWKEGTAAQVWSSNY